MKSKNKKRFVSLMLAGMITTVSVSCGSEKTVETMTEEETQPETETEPETEPVTLNAQPGGFLDAPDYEILQAENNRESDESESIADSETETDSQETEETTTTPTDDFESEISMAGRGNIYDTKGNILVKSQAGGKRKYSSRYGTALANILSEASGGVEYSMNDILSASDTGLGQSVQLTIDSDIQNAIYEYMQSINMVGAVVVLRTDGSVLADVSYPSFDPLSYYTSKEYAESIGTSPLENKSMMKNPPGSCFKIMTEIIADKHEIYSLYDDGTWYSDEGVIVDWDHDKGYYPVERSLYSAFTNSSNIFFAKVFDEIGEEQALSDLAELFHFGNGLDIECDFGNIESSIDITCKDDLRRSAFGQAYVRTCPMFLATLCREAIFGDMVRPFMIQNIIDSSGAQPVQYSGSEPYEVIATVPEEYRQNIRDAMLGVGSGLGVYAGSNYTFYAKTGTAETGGQDILYITGCMENINDNTAASPIYDNYSNYHENGSYIVVMQMQNPGAYGFNFSSESAYLYQGIINIIANQ